MTIKTFSKLSTFLFSLTLLLTLTACGGGGGGDEGGSDPQPPKVTVTFGLQGSAATTVHAVDLDVLLPTGFVLATDGSAQPTASALAFLVDGATTAANYQPESIAANGEIIAGIISTDGFSGNSSLLQISRTYAVGAALPTVADFMVTVIASDENGDTFNDITAQVSINVEPAP